MWGGFYTNFVSSAFPFVCSLTKRVTVVCDLYTVFTSVQTSKYFDVRAERKWNSVADFLWTLQRQSSDHKCVVSLCVYITSLFWQPLPKQIKSFRKKCAIIKLHHLREDPWSWQCTGHHQRNPKLVYTQSRNFVSFTTWVFVLCRNIASHYRNTVWKCSYSVQSVDQCLIGYDSVKVTIKYAKTSDSVQPARAKCGVGVDFLDDSVQVIIKYAKTSNSVQPARAECGVGVDCQDSVQTASHHQICKDK